MAYIVNDVELGFVDLYLVDTVGPGPLKLTGSSIAYGRYNSLASRFAASIRCLAAATFLFVQFAGTVSIGAVCELTRYQRQFGNSLRRFRAGVGGHGHHRQAPGRVDVRGDFGKWGWVQIGALRSRRPPALRSLLATRYRGRLRASSRRPWLRASRCSTRSSRRRSARPTARSRSRSGSR
jgi:hypothetical protein